MAEDGLRAMRQQNIDLSKDMAKLIQEGFSVFDGSLKQVEYFYPSIQVSWDQVRLYHAIEDGKQSL